MVKLRFSLAFALAAVMLLSACSPAEQTSAWPAEHARIIAATQTAYASEVAFSYQAARTHVMNATQTAEARDVTLYLESIHAQATAQAAQSTADAYAALQTATAEGRHAEQTAEAARLQGEATQSAYAITATAAERAYLDQQNATSAAATVAQRNWIATATADSAQATSAAATQAAIMRWTQEAIDRQATADTAAVEAQATAVAAQARIASLASERTAMMNRVTAVAPYVVGVCVLTLLAILIWKFARVEILRRRWMNADQAGVYTGDDFIHHSSRSPVAVIRQLPNGSFEAPQLVAPPDQAETTRRAQAIEALSVLPLPVSGKAPAGGDLRSKLLAVLTQPRLPAPSEIHMVTGLQQTPPAQLRAFINDILPDLYSDAIQGEIVEGEFTEAGDDPAQKGQKP